MAVNQLALTEPSLFALTAQHPLSVWWEEEEDRVVASLEAVVDAEVVVDVVEEVALDGLPVTPLRKTLKNPLKKTMAGAMSMTTTMTMAMTMTMIMTMTMTWTITMIWTMTMTLTMTMTTDLDVAEDEVVLEGLHEVAPMGLDHPARIT